MQDLPGLIAGLADLHTIACNGGLATRLVRAILMRASSKYHLTD